MINAHVVVDGSNIATEGRVLPSLVQLDEAVKALSAEFPDRRITVVVDATFGHRIDESEVPAYEEAVLAGELVTPPAGAIGRGDAFVLQIADKAGASVFSNDSFQEFHGEYSWLFDEGRLIGGKPVPEIGWVFVLRAPVRGPISRKAQRDAKVRKSRSAEAKAPAKAEAVAEGDRAPRTRKAAKAAKAAAPAKAAPAKAAPAKASRAAKKAPPAEPVAVGDASATAAGGRRRRRKRGGQAPEPVNTPGVFIEFVSAHPIASEVEGTVSRFSSHGAYVAIGQAEAYVPLRLMADPPPKSAKEVLTTGETRSFVVEAFDSPRRSIDLAIPGQGTGTSQRAGAVVEGAPAPTGTADQPTPAEEAPIMAAAKKATARKTAAKKTTAKKAPAKKAVTKKAPAKKTAAKKAPARKTAAKKAPAKKTTAKKAPARKTAAKKTTAKKAPARKTAAKKAPARKTAAKKAPARKTAAKKAPAKKSTTARKR